MKDWLPRLVAKVPARVHAKLLVAFLAIVCTCSLRLGLLAFSY